MIVQNSTKIVTHDNTFTLTENGAVKDRFTDTLVTLDTATQVDGISLPKLFHYGQFTYDNGEFELTPFGLEKMKKYLIQEVDKISSKIEFGNIDFNGSVLDTSTPSQIRINGAYSAVLIDPDKLIDFKNTDGTWSQLNATEITAIAEAVANHVQACFSNEKVLGDAINSKSTYSELMNIDLKTGWPSVINDPFNVDLLGV